MTKNIIKAVIGIGLTLVVFFGITMEIPRLNILEHTARNLFFHVPMWFAMMAGMGVSAWKSGKVLRTRSLIDDARAEQAALTATFFGLCGLFTGILWSRYTWYESAEIWWNNDPRQLFALIQILIYAGYFLLRSGMTGATKARISAVYNLFAFSLVPFLLYVLPRQFESLHPGAEGNPAFDEITAPQMRFVLYPAFILFIGLFWWIYDVRSRARIVELKVENQL